MGSKARPAKEVRAVFRDAFDGADTEAREPDCRGMFCTGPCLDRDIQPQEEAGTAWTNTHSPRKG